MNDDIMIKFICISLVIAMVPAIIYGFVSYGHLAANPPKWIRWMFPYRYDKRNPCRRYCRECGTKEEYYVYMFADGEVPIGWEPMGMERECSRKH